MPKCEHCEGEQKYLFEITHNGKTKIVCLVCKKELAYSGSTGITKEVKTKQQEDVDIDIQW